MAIEIFPVPSIIWLFTGMHRIFMWQHVGGPVKEKYQYIVRFVNYGEVKYIKIGAQSEDKWKTTLIKILEFL